jgi:putative ABC transport system permease protein
VTPDAQGPSATTAAVAPGSPSETNASEHVGVRSAEARRGFQLVWLLSARDFRWRARRYLISVLVTALVLGLALLLSGVNAGFDGEIRRTLDSFGASSWLVPQGSSGPFTAPVAFPIALAARAASLPGVSLANPVTIGSASASGPTNRDVNVIGVVPGGLGSPAGSTEQALARGEAVVDAQLGLHVGQALALNGAVFRVGAITHGMTYFAGIPTVRIALDQAERISLTRQPFATAIVTRGVPRRLPQGFHLLDNAQVRDDLARPVVQAKQTINLIRTLLWVVAAGIIAAVIYLAVLERVPDFAVMKAIGVSTRSLLLGLVFQAVALSISSALVAVGFAAVMAGQAGMAVDVSLASYVTLFILASLIGVLASAIALRRAVAVDPSSAFGG